jgi:hypothetical protein
VRGGALPPALLSAALGLALAYAPPRARFAAVLVLWIAAPLMALISLAPRWEEAVFLACWGAVILAAASVHLPRGLSTQFALALGLAIAVLAGAVSAVAGSLPTLLIALPWVLVTIPAAWLIAHGRGIGVKIISSWLIAIALLSAALPLTPTPGYVPDHLE